MTTATLYAKGLTVEVIDLPPPPPLPTLSIDNVGLPEGDSGQTPFVFTVTLSTASASPITVNYATADDTATAGSDYIAQSGSLTFLPGELAHTITVPVIGDRVIEPNEIFTVTLSAPSGATLAIAVGTGMIVNDDVPLPPPDTAVHAVPLNMSQWVGFHKHWWSGSAYSRAEYHECLTANNISLGFGKSQFAVGAKLLIYPSYGLWFGDETNEGVEVARFANPGVRDGTFVGNLGTLPDGPYVKRIVAYDAAGVRVAAPSESFCPHCTWIDRNGTAKDVDKVIVQNAAFAWTHSDGPTYFYTWMTKAQAELEEVPLDWFYIPTVDTAINAVTPHVFPGGEPVNTLLPPTQISRLLFAKTTDPNTMELNLPQITSRGIVVTESKQAYSVFDFFATKPVQPMRDGPRGKAFVTNPNAIWIGHGGTVYVLESHRLIKINWRGTVTTLAGPRHGGPHAPYHEEYGSTIDHPLTEYVGEWDPNIPIERRIVKEGWTLLFDLRASKHDFSLPLINLPPFGPLPQHEGVGPRLLCTDALGRVLNGQFHKTAPSAPPYITEFITGLNDPWGMALVDNTLYVGERLSHKISMWDATNGTSLGTFLENPTGDSFCYMDSPRRTMKLKPGVTLAQARAQTILGPEGMAHQDGWIYYAMLVTGEVRRKSTTTGEIQVCCVVPFFTGDQPHFIAIALSDGTFGPRGTIFTTTADNQNQGRPVAFYPSPGFAADGTPLTHSKRWTWNTYTPNVIRGPGGGTGAIYPLGIGISNGMIAHGSSGYGLDVFVQATLGEPQPDSARATRGHQWYCRNGYRLRNGNYCMGGFQFPLPWGKDADCDYFMQLCGRKP